MAGRGGGDEVAQVEESPHRSGGEKDVVATAQERRTLAALGARGGRVGTTAVVYW